MSLYDRRPNLTIGFHGCDEAIGKRLVVNPDKVRKSAETFDWLGHGFYVWENNYERALKWAEDKRNSCGHRRNLSARLLSGFYRLEFYRYCFGLLLADERQFFIYRQRPSSKQRPVE